MTVRFLGFWRTAVENLLRLFAAAGSHRYDVRHQSGRVRLRERVVYNGDARIWMFLSAMAAVCGLALAASAGVAAEKLDLRSRIDPLARPVIEDGIAVGMVIGVVQDG